MGHSNGAFMAHRWACETETLSGIVGFAGVLPLANEDCKFQRQLRVLQIHAVDDETILYDGDPVGYEGLSGYPSAIETIKRWAAVNGCESRDKSTQLDLASSIPNDDTLIQPLSGCKKRTELWTIRAYKSWKHSAHSPLLKKVFAEKISEFLLSAD